MRIPKWILYILVAIAAVAILFLLEFLIEYMWLGRHWGLSRMWINLVLVSLVEIALLQVVWRLPWWVWMLAVLFSGFTILYVPQLMLNPLFKNPAISWKGGQQAVYMIGVGMIALAFCVAILEIRTYRPPPPPPQRNDGASEPLPESKPAVSTAVVPDQLAQLREKKRHSA
jgi:hypothetical protein